MDPIFVCLLRESGIVDGSVWEGVQLGDGNFPYGGGVLLPLAIIWDGSQAAGRTNLELGISSIFSSFLGAGVTCSTIFELGTQFFILAWFTSENIGKGQYNGLPPSFVILHSKEIFCYFGSLLVNFGCLKFTSTIITITLLVEIVMIHGHHIVSSLYGWPWGACFCYFLVQLFKLRHANNIIQSLPHS